MGFHQVVLNGPVYYASPAMSDTGIDGA